MPRRRLPAGDCGEVVALQFGGQLRRCGLRVFALQAAQVGQDKGTLDLDGPEQHVVDTGFGIAAGVEHGVVGRFLRNLYCLVGSLCHSSPLHSAVEFVG
ncbi:hypothetical protein AHiyo1_20980 [Arthrobacter sp. Hiyo1]|nr:hypothetical protein AHiyo1_20980 [Arthrobacter sp. Hiyo1]